MALSTDLWQTNHDLALDILNQSFVQGLADGRLSRQCFAYYVGQDVFFLKAFARAYSIAGAKAPDWDGFCSLHALAGGVLEELQLHEKYAAEWGVDVIDVEPGVATRRYTDFLLATAWAYETGTALTAMSPCMRLYAYLGQQLEQLSPPEHQYIDWIRTYSSRDFGELAHQLEQLADRYASDTPLVRTTYRYAMECERDFFQAAYDSVNPDIA
ncbi:MAG: TenA family protein [Candidatus Desulfatibia sp.]|jgi:thiaminase/transcriptional activator TenA|uniref:TenA family protein n=1 Tax=Candidatus Desulfatibia sp. TaxID=3101189 RepID=UPI002F2DCDD4